MGKSRNKNHGSELRDLQQENQKLKREIKQLRKQLNKQPEEPTYEEFEELSQVAHIEANKCPDCNHNIKEIQIGSKVVYVCNNCNFRKVI